MTKHDARELSEEAYDRWTRYAHAVVNDDQAALEEMRNDDDLR